VYNADNQGSDAQVCCNEYYDKKERVEQTLNDKEVVRSTAGEECWGYHVKMGWHCKN
jgi:hypothetical protein